MKQISPRPSELSVERSAFSVSLPVLSQLHRATGAFLLLAAACLTNAQAAGIKIVTTTTDLADITRTVAGDLAEVSSITTGREDPHTLTAKPGFIVRARDADVWIRVGMELEIGWEPVILRDARNTRIHVGMPRHIDASDHVIRLEVPTQRVTRDQGDIHPEGNPHYWLDPLNGRLVAATVAERLSALYPEQKSAFEENLRRFERDLDVRMFGAALAGILYSRTKSIWGALAGEIIGTGIIGGLVAYPVAKYFLGSGVGAMFFVVPFLISTAGGSFIAWALYHTPVISFLQEKLGERTK